MGPLGRVPFFLLGFCHHTSKNWSVYKEGRRFGDATLQCGRGYFWLVNLSHCFLDVKAGVDFFSGVEDVVGVKGFFQRGE